MNRKTNWLNALLGGIYTGWCLIVFIVPIPLVVLGHLVLKLLDERTRLLKIYRIHRLWIAFLEFFTGLSFEVRGRDRIDPDQTYVFVCNHVNMLDIPIVGSTIFHPWKSLAKVEILRVPVVGWIIQNIAIGVDRKNQQSRKTSLLEMMRNLESGISIMIFPEGTRNRTDQPLKRFHPGAFSLAIRAQVPIMPLVILDSRPLQAANRMELYPGIARFTMLPPISTEGLTEDDVKDLAQRVHDQMEAYIRAHDAHFAHSTIESHRPVEA
ncbi:lysophospholipid acyltransferase family protein [Pontibacter sp. G13]|uniref:lysophospholipid acyltransferase family protein n=1 Tax=Pontibacter sp. G13 TaxID=3074898 RepID=UPI00288ABE2F|nr:lysophospholipid acyltransferase family protein [Pontibacter sp. G13]WNJ17648.1 lysophospholipid acyltransferase family protein [Pontibacter sp. G13]